MDLQIGIFIVDTISSIAFVVTAYYAFKANYDSAKMSKHSAEKDKKIMQFYQHSINERNKDRRIDDMVAYVQVMLSKWCRKTPAFRAITNDNKRKNTSAKSLSFKKQKIADDDVYFDGINLTFWRCVLNFATKENGRESDDRDFVKKVGEEIEKYRNENEHFDCIIRLLLSNLDDFTEPSEEKVQLFQCFRNSNSIYGSTTILNKIISSLYINKVVRNNLFYILKSRVPSSREDYDDELKNILGTISK